MKTAVSFILLLVWVQMGAQTLTQQKEKNGKYESFDIFSFCVSDKILHNAKTSYIKIMFNKNRKEICLNTKWYKKKLFCKIYNDSTASLNTNSSASGKSINDFIIWRKGKNKIMHFKSDFSNPSFKNVFVYYKNGNDVSVSMHRIYSPKCNYFELTPDSLANMPEYKKLGEINCVINEGLLLINDCNIREAYMLPDCDKVQSYANGRKFEFGLFLYLVGFPFFK